MIVSIPSQHTVMPLRRGRGKSTGFGVDGGLTRPRRLPAGCSLPDGLVQRGADPRDVGVGNVIFLRGGPAQRHTHTRRGAGTKEKKIVQNKDSTSRSSMRWRRWDISCSSTVNQVIPTPSPLPLAPVPHNLLDTESGHSPGPSDRLWAS